MDLFAKSAGVSSGEVPRTVFPGVIWDEAAEDEFGRLMVEWLERYPAAAKDPKARAQAEQTSRWYVERDLLQATIRREAEAAASMSSADAKWDLHRKWLDTYGAKMTHAIVKAVKDPQLRSPNLGRRL